MDNITKCKQRGRTVLAKGLFYFINPLFPLALSIVRAERTEQHPHDLTCIPHVHDFSELVIVSGGTGVQLVDGKRISVCAGDVFLLQGGAVHCFEERGTMELYNVQYVPDALPLPLEMLLKLPGYNMVFCVEPSLRRGKRRTVGLHLGPRELSYVLSLLSRLNVELREDTAASRCMALSILLELLVRIAQCHDRQREETQKPLALPQLAELISRLESEFSHPWTLSEMCAEVCMSQNTLLRLFRAATGKSPMQYLLECRLRNVARFLTETSWSLPEISMHCGFADTNYMSRRFSLFFHQPPGKYRRCFSARGQQARPVR